MPKGRGRKRKEEVPKGTGFTPKSKRSRPHGENGVEPTEQMQTRSTRSTNFESNGRRAVSVENSSNSRMENLPDPRQIMLKGNKSTNTTPVGETAPKDQCEATSSGAQAKCGDLAPVDPGTELDYEDNLDVHVSVTGGGSVLETETEDEESTLLEMIKTNPKLKKIFRQLVRDEPLAEPQEAAAVKGGALVADGNDEGSSR